MAEFLEALHSFFVLDLSIETWGPWLGGATALVALFEFIKKELRHFNERQVSKQLDFYDNKDIADARRYYVETNAQNIPPTEKYELSDSVTHKSPIIKFFLKYALKENGDSAKFYMVLGGSGMGKTTFMINLYIRYNQTLFKRPYDIKLFPIKDKETWSAIKEIKKSGKGPRTILLLDALDEDKKASDPGQFESRLNEIISKVKTFKEVVISCRTQFIPSRDIIEGELKIPRHGPRGGYYKLNVQYISPFDEKDINKYLRKRYGWFPLRNRKIKQDAKKLVLKSDMLMVRPMLLSYLDYLIKLKTSDIDTINISTIYEVMIDRWLEREADREPEKRRKEFKKQLEKFSSDIAVSIYDNFRNENRLELTLEEFNKSILKHNMEDWENPLKNIEARSKSLLNRDKDGNPKFAHKSILEYFLARNASMDKKIAYSLNFEGMDMMEQFCDELIPGLIKFVAIPGGTFGMGDDDNGPIHSVKLKDYSMSVNLISQLQWKEFMGNNPSRNKSDFNLPVESVSWHDCQEFIAKLNDLTGIQFRLPTEAEWEYAAGGGADEKTAWMGTNDSENLGNFAWYKNNSGESISAVGQKSPNELGLFDMSGNTWEWCSDWYSRNYYEECGGLGIVANPSGPSSGSFKVIRGGGFQSNISDLKITNRDSAPPGRKSKDLGFRLIRILNGE